MPSLKVYRSPHCAVLLIASIIVLGACSKAPSESRIRSQVVAALSQGGADRFYDVENIKKTNGFQKDDRTYVANIHYEIVFKEAINDLLKEMDSQTMPSAGSLAAAQVLGRALASGTKPVPGARVAFDEDVSMLKTDNGWQISNQ